MVDSVNCLSVRVEEFWGCNKTRAHMKSAEFAERIDRRIERVLTREDLTVEQKREIAETLSIPNKYEINVKEMVEISRD